MPASPKRSRVLSECAGVRRFRQPRDRRGDGADTSDPDQRDSRNFRNGSPRAERLGGPALRDRCSVLRRLRDAIFERREDIANVVTRETGKPRVEAILAEILLALDTADFLARQAPRWLRPERVPHHNIALKTKSGWLEFEPQGVVAIISPWNFPIFDSDDGGDSARSWQGMPYC